MDEKIRRAIAEKGLARSSIVILNALLKLCQACCAPQLEKLKANQKLNRKMPGDSAKLAHFMELLPTLVEVK